MTKNDDRPVHTIPEPRGEAAADEGSTAPNIGGSESPQESAPAEGFFVEDKAPVQKQPETSKSSGSAPTSFWEDNIVLLLLGSVALCGIIGWLLMSSKPSGPVFEQQVVVPTPREVSAPPQPPAFQRSTEPNPIAPTLAPRLQQDVMTGLAQYCNGRFAFCVEYLTQLRADPPPANGDGQIWNSSDGSITMRASGMHFGPEMTFDALWSAASATDPNKKFTVRDRKATSFVVSYWTLSDGKIHYDKTIVRDDVFAELSMEWTEANRHEVDHLVGAIAKSFSFGP